MNPQTIVYVLHGLFAAFLLGAVLWVVTRPNPRDDRLIEDFLFIERRKRVADRRAKRVADRRAKRRSPESNGRRSTDNG